jgi:hypothetical protein
MQHLDLDDEQTAALIALLKRAIADDPCPLSPRVQTLGVGSNPILQ